MKTDLPSLPASNIIGSVTPIQSFASDRNESRREGLLNMLSAAAFLIFPNARGSAPRRPCSPGHRTFFGNWRLMPTAHSKPDKNSKKFIRKISATSRTTTRSFIVESTSDPARLGLCQSNCSGSKKFATTTDPGPSGATWYALRSRDNSTDHEATGDRSHAGPW